MLDERRAPRRRPRCRRRPGRTRSRACGSAAAGPGVDHRADRLAVDRRPARPGGSVAAITDRTPDQAAIAAASLLAMPPLPRWVPAPPATASSAASTSAISSMSDASASTRGSAVKSPSVSVRSKQVGPHQVGDECGEAIVVAVADLVVGDGVVLVHDGRHMQVEQPPERLAACRYCARCAKSCGVSSTWPATTPCWPKIALKRSMGGAARRRRRPGARRCRSVAPACRARAGRRRSRPSTRAPPRGRPCGPRRSPGTASGGRRRRARPTRG